MAYSNPAAEKYIAEHPENVAYRKAYEAKVRASEPGTAPKEGQPGDLPGALRWGPEGEPSGIPSSMLAAPGSQPVVRHVEPPEYHPPSPPGIHPFRDFLMSLPHVGTDMYTEPSLTQARIATGKMGLKKSDPEYQRFADEQWNAAVEKTKRETPGRGIVRVSASKPEHLGGKALKAAETEMGDLPGQAAATGLGALDTVSGGAATRLLPSLEARRTSDPNARETADVIASLQEEHPVAAGIGNMAGFATGEGVPGALGRKGIAMGLGKAGTAALQAGGTHAATGLSQMGADKALRRPTLDAGDLLGGSLASAALGGALGGLGAGAHKFQEATRGEFSNPGIGPAISQLEAAGGRLGPIAGAKLSPDMEGIVAESKIPGPAGEKRFASDIAARRAAEPIAKKISARSEALKHEWTGDDQFVEGFLPKYERFVKEPQDVRLLLDEMQQIAGERTVEGGHALAFSDVPAVRNAIDSMKSTGGYLPVGQFETVMKSLAEAADKKELPEPVYSRLAAIGRQVRDTFPWPEELGPAPVTKTDDGWTVRGFSAKHAQMHQKLTALEDQLTAAGVDRNATPKGMQNQLQNSVRNFGAQTHDALTDALRQLAENDPETLKALLTSRGLEAAKTLGGAENPVNVTRTGMLRSTRLRTDPILGVLGHTIPALAVPATSGKGTEDLRKQILGIYGP